MVYVLSSRAHNSLVRVEWHLILKYLTELKMAFWDFKKCHLYVVGHWLFVVAYLMY